MVNYSETLLNNILFARNLRRDLCDLLDQLYNNEVQLAAWTSTSDAMLQTTFTTDDLREAACSFINGKRNVLKQTRNMQKLILLHFEGF